MKKETKKSITAGIIIMSVLCAYYFIFYLSQEKRYLANQIKCQQEATQLFERLKREYGKNVVSEPNFRFIKGEEICLYKGSFSGGGVVNWFIKNVYTNETVVSFAYVTKDGKTTLVTEEGRLKFTELEEKYFVN